MIFLKSFLDIFFLTHLAYLTSNFKPSVAKSADRNWIKLDLELENIRILISDPNHFWHRSHLIQLNMQYISTNHAMSYHFVIPVEDFGTGTQTSRKVSSRTSAGVSLRKCAVGLKGACDLLTFVRKRTSINLFGRIEGKKAVCVPFF